MVRFHITKETLEWLGISFNENAMQTPSTTLLKAGEHKTLVGWDHFVEEGVCLFIGVIVSMIIWNEAT